MPRPKQTPAPSSTLKRAVAESSEPGAPSVASPGTHDTAATPLPPSPKSQAGRPSKLETRAWEVFSRRVTPLMQDQRQLAAQFHEALRVAAAFGSLWSQRQHQIAASSAERPKQTSSVEAASGRGGR